MKLKDERYELYFEEQINGGGKEDLNAIVIDVCPRGCPPMLDKKPCIVFMSEDKGTIDDVEQGHIPFGYIAFKNLKNLSLAQQGLEMIQRAIMNEDELKEMLPER